MMLPVRWTWREMGCLYRKSDSATIVMKSAEDGRRYDAAHVLDGAMDRRIHPLCYPSPQLRRFDTLARPLFFWPSQFFDHTASVTSPSPQGYTRRM